MMALTTSAGISIRWSHLIAPPIFNFTFLYDEKDTPDPAGVARPLAFRSLPTDEVKEPAVNVNVPMEHGSLCITGHSTNAANQHSIMPTKAKVAKRRSVIFRRAKRIMTMADVKKHAKA